MRATHAQAEKRAQKLLKAAKKAYKVAERANAHVKSLQDSMVSAPPAKQRELADEIANAVKDATAAKVDWDAAYALAKEAMKALEQ